MTQTDSLQQYVKLRAQMFLETFGARDLDIIGLLPQDHFFHQLRLFLTRRAGEGELEIFCGYHKEAAVTKAIFLSNYPGKPIMLLDMGVVRQRIDNMRDKGIPFEQSREALDSWPD